MPIELILTMEYYPAMKRMSTDVRCSWQPRLNLENIMQSERRQSQSHILGDHLHTILRVDKSVEQKTGMYLPKPGVWGRCVLGGNGEGRQGLV